MLISKISYSNKSIYNVVKIKVMRLSTIFIEIFTVIASIIGVFIGILIQTFVGLIAFFTEENSSFWLIIQKFTFFLVFTPLEFYPEIVQKIFSILPTTYLIYAPARIFTKFEIGETIVLLGLEILSGLVLYGIIRLMYMKGVRKINVNGG